jgi:hypothetical protein
VSSKTHDANAGVDAEKEVFLKRLLRAGVDGTRDEESHVNLLDVPVSPGPTFRPDLSSGDEEEEIVGLASRTSLYLPIFLNIFCPPSF